MRDEIGRIRGAPSGAPRPPSPHFELAPVPILRMEPDTRILDANVLASKLLGVSVDTLAAGRCRLTDFVLGKGQRLTRQLLDLARHKPDDVREVDLAMVLEEMVALARPLLKKGGAITLDTPPDGQLLARVEEDSFEQAVLNLLRNAEDEIGEGGRIQIRLRAVDLPDGLVTPFSQVPSGSYAALAVEDNGSGMSEEVRRRIFEPFFTTKDVGKGTGLGLPMVYQMIKRVRGAIDVQSRPGEGTTFLLYLPVVRPVREPGEGKGRRAESDTGALADRRILLVDDEPTIRSRARQVLEDHGAAEVRVCADADEAVRLLDSGWVPDAVLSDVVMPGANGVDLADRIRAIFPGLPVVLMSAYASRIAGIPRQRFAPYRFLRKPFHRKELVDCLLEAFEERPSKGG